MELNDNKNKKSNLKILTLIGESFLNMRALAARRGPDVSIDEDSSIFEDDDICSDIKPQDNFHSKKSKIAKNLKVIYLINLARLRIYLSES